MVVESGIPWSIPLRTRPWCCVAGCSQTATVRVFGSSKPRNYCTEHQHPTDHAVARSGDDVKRTDTNATLFAINTCVGQRFVDENIQLVFANEFMQNVRHDTTRGDSGLPAAAFAIS